jgi:hypothetical protein
MKVYPIEEVEIEKFFLRPNNHKIFSERYKIALFNRTTQQPLNICLVILCSMY